MWRWLGLWAIAGMASILGGELVPPAGRRADARLYVGGLPERPTPPFQSTVFSVEGLINEYGAGTRSCGKAS